MIQNSKKENQNMVTKVVKIACAATGTALLAWIGAAGYASNKVDTEIKALSTAAHKPGEVLRVVKVNHNKGFFSSQGEAEIAYVSQSHCEPGAVPAAMLKVSYTVSHLPLPTGFQRFTWQATPVQANSATFQKLFDGAQAINGTGSVGIRNALQVAATIPSMKMEELDGSSMKLSPTTASMRLQGMALSMHLQSTNLSIGENGKTTDFENLQADIDFTDKELGLGKTTFTIAKVTAADSSLEGLRFIADVEADKDRVNMRFAPSVKRLKINSVELQDFVFETQIKGLDLNSTKELSALTEINCGMDNMPEAEAERWRTAINTLLSKGLSASISKLAGKSKEGSLKADLTVELTPQPNNLPPSLAQQLRAHGAIFISKGALKPDEEKMLLSLGFAEQKADGLHASFDYKNKVLQVNNKPREKSEINAMLESADIALRSAILHLGQRPQEDAGPLDGEESEAEDVAE
jgi:uncharacterized protein YdgA (DUF945 family)